jgi:hypothetical protein
VIIKVMAIAKPNVGNSLRLFEARWLPSRDTFCMRQGGSGIMEEGAKVSSARQDSKELGVFVQEDRLREEKMVLYEVVVETAQRQDASKFFNARLTA